MTKEPSENYCTLYLVRHGETEWNVKHIVMGQKDSPLTDLGIEQVLTTAQELKDVKFDAIFSSDSLRAQRTAELIKLDRELAIETSKLLRERSHGHFEGQSVVEYKEETKDLFEKMQQASEAEKWNFKFSDDVESNEELVTRFIRQIREIAVAAPNKTILVVTHGGCIRTFLMRMGYGTQAQLQPGSVGNAGYIKVLSDGVDFFIKEVKGVKML